MSGEAMRPRDATAKSAAAGTFAPALSQFKYFPQKKSEATVNQPPVHLGRLRFLAHIC